MFLKIFIDYVKPGDYRIKSSAPDHSNIYPLVFKNDTANTNTVVLINDNAEGRVVKLQGSTLPAQFQVFVTSANDDCKDDGIINTADGFLLPANSVVTLYNKN